MQKITNKFKQGAASFYIVAFSTLILVIIAASFAAVIISEVTRTSNDDLSQSAYDSALAGVEDAKLAFYNYQSCIQNGTSSIKGCEEIIKSINNPTCDMVGNILGRGGAPENTKNEVIIQESNTNNNMQQAYTCVKIETKLKDYRATLSSSNLTKVVRAKFDGVDAKDIAKVKVSWFEDTEKNRYQYTNFPKDSVTFPRVIAGATGTVYSYSEPPTLSVSLVQTSTGPFNLSDFDKITSDSTNRGTVFLVPTNSQDAAINNKDHNYRGACASNSCDEYGQNNVIKASDIVKSNSRIYENLPFAVYCPENSGNEFVCSATLELPQPINGPRSDETFILAISIPYGRPTTDFSLEFYCADGTVCSTATGTSDDGSTEPTPSNLAILDSVQIKIDSTGRANDLYRRVETRLEGADTFSLSALGPLELLGGGNDDLFRKTQPVTEEYNF